MPASFELIGPRWADNSPLWSASIRITEELQRRSARLVYGSAKSPNFPLPGTMLVHAQIDSIKVNLGTNSLREFPATGVVQSSFIVAADPDEWKLGPIKIPRMVCLQGQFPCEAFFGSDFSRLPVDFRRSIQLVFPEGLSLLQASSSGFLFEGRAKMPDTVTFAHKLPIRLELAKPQSNKPGLGDFIFLLDRDRLTEEQFADGGHELLKYFRELVKIRLNPRSHNQSSLRWVRLELADIDRVPEFHWRVDIARPNETNVQFPQGAWKLYIADQDLEEVQTPPRGVLTATPSVVLSRDSLSVSGGANLPVPNGTAEYAWTAFDGTETWSLNNVAFQYNPIEVARSLRTIYDLPTPRLDDFDEDSITDNSRLTAVMPNSDGKIDPAVLWGFMQLGDGWAQLPFLNCTEQILVDALPPYVKPASQTIAELKIESQFRGAAVFGNDRPEIYDPQRGQAPWNLAILDAASFAGKWSFNADRSLGSVVLTLLSPELTSEGMLSIAAVAPTAQDALPSVDDWIGGKIAIALKTPQTKLIQLDGQTLQENAELYPSPFLIAVQSLTFKAHKPETPSRQPTFELALLETFNWSYQANEFTHLGTVSKSQLGPDQTQQPVSVRLPYLVWLWLLARSPFKHAAFWGASSTDPIASAKSALAWRRHPTCPAVQNLPLTQNTVPANHLSSSRALFPFQFALEKSAATSTFPFGYFKPKNWAFRWSPAQMAFEAASILLRPASELDHNGRLSLASLGLPGLALALPSDQPQRDLRDPSGFLARLMIRHDLPLLDQPYALADVPAEKDTASPPPPPTALDRVSLAAHFRKLENRAVLSEVHEAEAVFKSADNQVEVTGLVEPHGWSARLNVDLNGFPANASLTDMQSGFAIEWAGETEEKDALRGIDGAFDLDSKLKLKPGGRFELVAGSMSTVSERVANATGLRDQRGLVRTATQITGKFMVSSIAQIQAAETKRWSLLTCLEPLPFSVGEDHSQDALWKLWFRGLPMQRVGTGPFVFERTGTISKARRGVNDPEADGRDLGPLNDYQWRLGLGTATSQKWLPLGPLRFFPLTLEKVEVEENGTLKTAEIVGRLELPCLGLDGHLSKGDFSQYDTAVVVTVSQGSLSDIRSATLESDPDRAPGAADNKVPKTWPLADTDLPFDRPLLVWKSIQIVKVNGRPKAIQIPAGESEIQYTRNGLAWRATSQDSCGFSLTTPTSPQKMRFTVPVQPTADIGVSAVTLTLDANAGQHKLTAEWFFRLGNTTRLQINGAYEDRILGPGSSNITAQLAHAGRSIELSITPAKVSLDDFGFSFSWENFGSADDSAVPVDPTGWQLLPGMHLAPPEQQPCRGVAMVAFRRSANADEAFPRFTLSGAYFDVLFNCFWGQSLQDACAPDRLLNRENVFGSSAGRVQAEYHSALHKTSNSSDAWPFELSLSGLLEIKNVYSWPANLAFGDQGKVTVPTRKDHAGHHWRHTARLLLSEFRVSSIDPVVNQEPIIIGSTHDDVILTIQPGRVWNVAAQVEHQLVRIQTEDGTTFVDTAQELRWTAVQQVRFASALALYNQLVKIKDKVVLDSVTTQGSQLDQWTFKASFDVLYGMNSRVILRALNIMDNMNRIVPFEQSKLNDLAECLLIDGTFPFFIKREPQSSNEPPGTYLQSVLGGSVTGNSAVRSDFANHKATAQVSTDQAVHGGTASVSSTQISAEVAVASAAAQGWLFVQLPFLGRLQSQARSVQSPNKLLSSDPVVELMETPALQPQAVWLHAITSRAINQSLTVQYSQIDRARLRTIQRLDPSSLDEAWLRLYLIREQFSSTGDLTLPQLTTAASSSDSLIATARPENIHRLFDPRRQNNPPRRLPPMGLSKPSAVNFEWTPQSLALWNAKIQTDANLNLDNEHPFAFLPWIVYLKDAGLLESSGKQRHMAATLIPAADVEPDTLFHSVSLAISAFTGISYCELSPKRAPLLRTVELLVFDASRSRIEKAGEQVFHKRSDDLLAWSQAIIRSNAFDTPAAILRIRDLNEIGNQQAVEIAYQFLEVPYETEAVELRRRTLPIQSIPEQRRFPQPQFGGNAIAETVAFQGIELAPPAVQGCQPLRLLERPVPAHTSVDGQSDVPDVAGGEWPWGLSGMRLSTTYRQRAGQSLGTIGLTGEGIQETWWQACALRVQFEVAKDRTLLPDAHRTAAIPGFLPTWSSAPMPTINDITNALAGKAATPVLPGHRCVLTTGLRAGAPYAFRESIVTQRVTKQLAQQMTTSSLPVQHRAPRPVLLPKSQTNRQDIALQTWGSWFDLQSTEAVVRSRTLCVSRHPKAEFLVAKADGTAVGLQVGMVRPTKEGIQASGLSEEKKKELLDSLAGFPSEGVLPSSWHGMVYLEQQALPAGSTPSTNQSLVCTFGKQDFEYISLENSLRFWAPAKQRAQDVAAKVHAMPPGSMVQWRLSIDMQTSKIMGYRQIACLLTRVDDPTFASAMAPRFLSWEDPEYNRRLTSLTARKEFQVKTSLGEMVVLALVADRREYNANGKINYAVVTTTDLTAAQTAALPTFHFTFQIVRNDGSKSAPVTVDGTINTIPNRTELAELLGNELKPGDIIRLEVSMGASVPIPPTLDLAIVALPVIPTPESAYAILRRLDNHDACVRFGWGVDPTFSELLDPDDLHTQIVRRRAIFTAVDTLPRSMTNPTYAVQKTTAHGATHFPIINIAD